MRLNGLDAVTLGVEDLEAARSFYRNFGLADGAQGGAHADFETLDGSEILVRGANDAGLPSAVRGGSTVREMVWGVESKDDLAAIAAELSKDRQVYEDAEGVLHSADDDGFGIAFRVERRRKVPPAPNPLNIFGATPNRPINTPVDFHEAVRPAAMAHVVLLVPDVERSARFYQDRLGFRLTDKFKGGKGAFLRCSNSTYHHTLFLLQGEERGLHHIAFHVTDFNQVMMGGKNLLAKGWQPAFGPGRHVIGSNYFWYFQSPCGGAMELTADMDRADDGWITREWDYKPENTAAWSMTFNAPG